MIAANNSTQPRRVTVLNQNAPNPFNPSTTLSFVLAKDGRASLKIYNLRGELVTTLIDSDLQAGPHSMQWNGKDASGKSVASGSYLVRLVAPDKVTSRQITLVK